MESRTFINPTLNFLAVRDETFCSYEVKMFKQVVTLFKWFFDPLLY